MYTNAPVTGLINAGCANRTPVYLVTSLTTEIYSKRKGSLSNGVVYLDFDPAFRKLITSNPDDLVIMVTPTSGGSGIFLRNRISRSLSGGMEKKSALLLLSQKKQTRRCGQIQERNRRLNYNSSLLYDKTANGK